MSKTALWVSCVETFIEVVAMHSHKGQGDDKYKNAFCKLNTERRRGRTTGLNSDTNQYSIARLVLTQTQPRSIVCSTGTRVHEVDMLTPCHFQSSTLIPKTDYQVISNFALLGNVHSMAAS